MNMNSICGDGCEWSIMVMQEGDAKRYDYNTMEGSMNESEKYSME
jgi:hypothetical protein